MRKVLSLFAAALAAALSHGAPTNIVTAVDADDLRGGMGVVTNVDVTSLATESQLAGRVPNFGFAYGGSTVTGAEWAAKASYARKAAEADVAARATQVESLPSGKLTQRQVMFDDLRTNLNATATAAFRSAVRAVQDQAPAQDMRATSLTEVAGLFDDIRTNAARSAQYEAVSNLVRDAGFGAGGAGGVTDMRDLTHKAEYYDDVRTGKVASVTSAFRNAVQANEADVYKVWGNVRHDTFVNGNGYFVSMSMPSDCVFEGPSAVAGQSSSTVRLTYRYNYAFNDYTTAFASKSSFTQCPVTEFEFFYRDAGGNLCYPSAPGAKLYVTLRLLRSYQIVGQSLVYDEVNFTPLENPSLDREYYQFTASGGTGSIMSDFPVGTVVRVTRANGMYAARRLYRGGDQFPATSLSELPAYYGNLRTNKNVQATAAFSNAVNAVAVQSSAADARALLNKDKMFDDIRTNRDAQVTAAFSNAVNAVGAGGGTAGEARRIRSELSGGRFNEVDAATLDVTEFEERAFTNRPTETVAVPATFSATIGSSSVTFSSPSLVAGRLSYTSASSYASSLVFDTAKAEWTVGSGTYASTCVPTVKGVTAVRSSGSVRVERYSGSTVVGVLNFVPSSGDALSPSSVTAWTGVLDISTGYVGRVRGNLLTSADGEVTNDIHNVKSGMSHRAVYSAQSGEIVGVDADALGLRSGVTTGDAELRISGFDAVTVGGRAVGGRVVGGTRGTTAIRGIADEQVEANGTRVVGSIPVGEPSLEVARVSRMGAEYAVSEREFSKAGNASKEIGPDLVKRSIRTDTPWDLYVTTDLGFAEPGFSGWEYAGVISNTASGTLTWTALVTNLSQSVSSYPFFHFVYEYNPKKYVNEWVKKYPSTYEELCTQRSDSSTVDYGYVGITCNPNAEYGKGAWFSVQAGNEDPMYGSDAYRYNGGEREVVLALRDGDGALQGAMKAVRRVSYARASDFDSCGEVVGMGEITGGSARMPALQNPSDARERLDHLGNVAWVESEVITNDDAFVESVQFTAGGATWSYSGYVGPSSVRLNDEVDLNGIRSWKGGMPGFGGSVSTPSGTSNVLEYVRTPEKPVGVWVYRPVKKSGGYGPYATWTVVGNYTNDSPENASVLTFRTGAKLCGQANITDSLVTFTRTNLSAVASSLAPDSNTRKIGPSETVVSTKVVTEKGLVSMPGDNMDAEGGKLNSYGSAFRGTFSGWDTVPTTLSGYLSDVLGRGIPLKNDTIQLTDASGYTRIVEQETLSFSNTGSTLSTADPAVFANDGGRKVAGSLNGTVVVSTDGGMTWSTPSGAPTGIGCVAYFNGRFYFGQSSGANVYYTSDFSTWTSTTPGSSGGYTITKWVGFAVAGGKLAAFGATSGGYSRIFFTDNGTTWKYFYNVYPDYTPLTISWIDHPTYGPVFIAYSKSSSRMYADGIRVSASQTGPAVFSSTYVTGVPSVSQVSKIWAVSSGSQILMSMNDATSYSEGASMLRSVDGIAFSTASYEGFGRYGNPVHYNGYRYVTDDKNGHPVESKDGISWSTVLSSSAYANMGCSAYNVFAIITSTYGGFQSGAVHLAPCAIVESGPRGAYLFRYNGTWSVDGKDGWNPLYPVGSSSGVWDDALGTEWNLKASDGRLYMISNQE